MNSLQDLQCAVGGELRALPAAPGEASSISIGRVVVDSREVAPGDTFWAVPGRSCDGEEFADEAFDRGAAGAVVSREVPVPSGRWLVRVDDPAEALWQWAAWKRRQFRGNVIVVAGSVGKTTTRQMIHTVLKARLRGTAPAADTNNPLAFPLSMLPLEPGDDYVVLELGASAREEISRRVEVCRPTVGVVTHVADAQLAGFTARPRIAEAHAELLAALPSDGRAVLGDDPWLRRVASRSKAPITWVGRGVACDLAASDVQWSQGRLSFRLADCLFTVPVWGRHHLTSALIAVAVGQILGADPPETAAALEHFDAVPVPCEVSDIRGATILRDAHHGSPASMRAALELLRDFDAAGRRIVVLGDMTDVGHGAAILHRQLGNQVVTLCGADLLIACGQFAGDVVAAARAAGMPPRHAIACRSPEECLPYLGQIILPGDAVLVKGAGVSAMGHVVEALRQYPRRRTA